MNRLILRLLPLALPPHASTPYVYALGISCFLPVYAAFECSLRAAVSSQPGRSALPFRLHHPKLERSLRLQYDLEYLLPSFECSRISYQIQKIFGENRNQTLFPHLQAFVAHIHDSTTVKPHLLLAYTWIFYMALFSGGRYIHAKLSAAGPAFWAHIPTYSTNGPVKGKERGFELPLGFWDVSNLVDDEDLRADYKSRIQEIEQSLTPDQRNDIVNEAVEIMERLLLVVGEAELHIPNGDIQHKSRADILMLNQKIHARQMPDISFLALLLKHMLPMGMTDLLDCFNNLISWVTEKPPIIASTSIKAE